MITSRFKDTGEREQRRPEPHAVGLERGIGSYWIGFATGIGNAPDAKRELKIPDEYELVVPIILGYPDGPTGKGVRKEARVMTWRK